MLFLHDLTRQGQAAYDAAEAAIARQLAEVARVPAARILHLHNKADGAADAAQAVAPGQIALSARTGAGLDTLRRALLERAGWQAATEGVAIARKRHVLALQRCGTHLQQARDQAAAGDAALELFAEELRLAHEALGEITGAFTPDDLLGEIFAGFCIGK